MSKVSETGSEIFLSQELSEWITIHKYVFNRIKLSDKSTHKRTKGRCYSMTSPQSGCWQDGDSSEGRWRASSKGERESAKVRSARRQRLEIYGKSLSKVLKRCYNSDGMASGAQLPRVRWGRRTGHRWGSQGTLGTWRCHLSYPSRKRAPLTWAPPPGSCGQRGELGDTSKSLSSSASPSDRGRFQGPGGGHGCSMSGYPRPYNAHCQQTWREWNQLRRASRPSGPGPLPRIPLLAATPTHAPR